MKQRQTEAGAADKWQLLYAAGPIAMAFFVNGALFGAWASRIPTVKSAFELSPSSLGLLLLVLAGGAVVAFPLAGRTADRLGARGVTRILAVLYVGAFLAIGLAPSIWTLVLALFAFGATHGGMDVTMNTWGTALERQKNIVALPALHATFSLGAGAGAATGYFALQWGLSVAQHALLLSVPMLVLSLIPGGVATAGQPQRRGVREPVFRLPTATILVVGIVAFSITLGEGAMADWSAVFLVEQTGVVPSHAALGYTVFSLAMVTMRLLGGAVLRVVGPQSAVLASGAIAACGAFLAAMTQAYGIALLGFLLMGLGFALIMPLSMSAAANVSEDSAGRAIAGVAIFGYGGLLLGPPIIGFLADAAGFPVALGAIGLLALVACLGSSNFRA
ncbi:MAG: MFS transporter [Rhodobacter sp.]|nr:MFS transporter [Rhodobacter sp.]